MERRRAGVEEENDKGALCRFRVASLRACLLVDLPSAEKDAGVPLQAQRARFLSHTHTHTPQPLVRSRKPGGGQVFVLPNVPSVLVAPTSGSSRPG